MYDPRQQGRGKIEDLHLTDVAPTVLETFGLPIPAGMQGKRIGYRKG
jgi:bisphosphoglycerate-independent phosphoglycerate mutase (AlkP superfamily)